MPNLRTIAKRKVLPNTIASKETAQSLLDVNFPARIIASPTKAALIPFAVRSVIDYRKNKPLTPLQEKIFRFLQRTNADTKLLRRYERFPQTVQKAFDQKYFTGTQVDADMLLKKTISSASEKIHTDLKAAFKKKIDYVLATGFKPFTVPYASLVGIFAGIQPLPPQDIYNFEVSYRGITTIEASDRSGGVEPYLVSSFCRVPTSGGLELLAGPSVIKQNPWNLGSMKPTEWMPSGGQQDANGNPSNPIILFNGDFPPYDSSLAYWSIVKVMEEDGGQGDDIAAAMGDALVVVGGALITVNAIAGAIVTALGAVCELIAAIWSSSEADDFIGDLLIWYDSSYICSNSFIERGYAVSEGGNNWTLYYGIRSMKMN
jgi:hypothetical protein